MELSELSWSIRGTLGRKLLKKSLQYEGVVVTPGISFGDAFDGYIRLAFTLNDDLLREGARRIRQFIESLNS